MSYVYFESRKTRQFGKSSDKGIHLLKPTAQELAQALETAERDGFKQVYVYDTKRKAVDIAEQLSEETGIMIGWSSFCLSIDAFRIDY